MKSKQVKRKRLPPSLHSGIYYKRSIEVLAIRDDNFKTVSFTSGSFAPSAPVVRPLAVDSVVSAVSVRMFCKARGLEYDDFFFMLQVYVFTVVGSVKFFTISDASGFTGLSLSSARKRIYRLDELGWFQRVATGEKSVNWKQWKGPLKPKFQYMLAIKANNLLIEWWDYTQQIKANFKVDYLDNLPELE